jgi:hypothetical protein
MIGVVPEPIFMALFAGAMVGVAAYLLCVVKLGRNLRDMKRRGLAPDAPDILFSFEGVPAIVWLITGRYARLGDEAVTFWSTLARILLLVLVPFYVLMFGNVILHIMSGPPSSAG